jgi:hypothetical protein
MGRDEPGSEAWLVETRFHAPVTASRFPKQRANRTSPFSHRAEFSVLHAGQLRLSGPMDASSRTRVEPLMKDFLQACLRLATVSAESGNQQDYS